MWAVFKCVQMPESGFRCFLWAAPLKVMKTVGRRCGEVITMNPEILTFCKTLEFCSKDTYYTILDNKHWGLPKYFWSGKFWGELGRKLGNLKTFVRHCAKRRKCNLEGWAERLTQRQSRLTTGHACTFLLLTYQGWTECLTQTQTRLTAGHACTFLCINRSHQSYKKESAWNITQVDSTSSSNGFHHSL